MIGAVGLVVEIMLRRLYNVPHHLQIIATFGLFLLSETWCVCRGPAQVMPIIPELQGAIEIAGRRFPDYFLMYGIALAILCLLWLCFTRHDGGFSSCRHSGPDMVGALDQPKPYSRRCSCSAPFCNTLRADLITDVGKPRHGCGDTHRRLAVVDRRDVAYFWQLSRRLSSIPYLHRNAHFRELSLL
jgi:hypothetical protein